MKRLIVLACVLGLVSFANAADVRNLVCPPIDGVDQVLHAPGAFIGDMHGTEESPDFLARLSCHVVKSGRPLVVAMEYQATDQPVLNDFLLIADEEAASRRLTGTDFWAQNRDGRASPHMRDALLAIRSYARAGGQLELVAYDFWGATAGERDKASAEFIRQKREKDSADAYWIVFGGNVHARKIRGLPGGLSDDHEPLGYLIRDWGLIHLNAWYRGGAGWACMEHDCTILELGPPCSTDCPPHPVIRLQQTDPAYDGVYDVGKLTPSPPLYGR